MAKPVWLHPAKMKHNAPSGCILFSDTDNPDDGVVIAAVDPHGLAMTDIEAEAMAEEICTRWNSFNHKHH